MPEITLSLPNRAPRMPKGVREALAPSWPLPPLFIEAIYQAWQSTAGLRVAVITNDALARAQVKRMNELMPHASNSQPAAALIGPGDYLQGVRFDLVIVCADIKKDQTIREWFSTKVAPCVVTTGSVWVASSRTEYESVQPGAFA